jgi:hypothetical protein
MKSILLFISLFLLSQLQSQISIYGSVKNKNGKSLKGAHIYEVHQEKGVPTDDVGNYFIELKKDSLRLIFSHIGYKSKELIINKADLQKNQKIDVILSKKSETIETIEVTASPIKKVIDQDNLLILDFDFYGDALILLQKNPEKGYFIEIKKEEEKSGVRFQLDFKPKSFEYDCFGNIQVISKDSTYQLVFQDEEFRIVDRYSLLEYQELIKPCKVSNDSFFVFKSEGEHGQSINYTLFPKDTSKEKEQIQILDMVAWKVAAFYYIEIINLYNSITPYGRNVISNGIWDGDMKDLNDSPKLNQMIVFYDKILSRPIYSPIFSLDNQLILFDHTNGFIEEIHQSKKTKIEYFDSRKWIELVSYDKWNKEFVTYFKNKGIYTAHYINIETGEIKDGVILEENAYPENLKLKSGYVYYLHKSINDFYGNVLLKQKIDL